tara:strand:- start:315 stop:977 length:663 start_codon:yes stop_codon:yes gene_type:complete
MIWEEIFRSRTWGRYPPEELVRVVTKFVRKRDQEKLACIEIGSGPGANALLLSDLFETYAAIDISETAIELLSQRIKEKTMSKELKVGCISSLPWPDSKFDFICDNFSIYANKMSIINSCLKEIKRVMKNDAIFYSRVWSKNCYGLESGDMIEKNTYDNLKVGPCAGYGISHFFDLEEILNVYGNFFKIQSIKRINNCLISVDGETQEEIEEFIVISGLK